MGAKDGPGKHDDLTSSEEQGDVPGQNGSSDRAKADSPTRLTQRLKRFPDGHPSSPNNEDGSPRPPVGNLRDSESAAENDGDEPDPESAGDEPHPADGAADRASRPENTKGQPEQPEDRAEPAEDQPGHAENRPEHADDRGSEGWRAALPRLQALWERHKERWPAEQRTPVDRSTDEPGSWRGDAGHYLNFEENLVTEHALDRVHKAEPEVTRTMKAVESDVPGARLAGLDYCLKGEDRFKEKIAGSLALKPERAVGKETDAIPDALRYTCQLSTENYVDGCRAAGRQLQGHGYQLVVSRNSWESLDYKGINTRWLTTEGRVFEVQFHTPESFEAKQLTHGAYERLRNPLTDKSEMGELRQFQRQVTAQIPVPDLVSDIRNFSEKDG